jgi:hypothetical protein
MITVPKIREQLLDLLANYSDESLSAFEEWLTTASWNMHLASEFSAQKFVGEIQLRIAESEAEDHSPDWLKGKLRSILYQYSRSLSDKPLAISSSSSATFTSQEWAFSVVGKQRVVACG